MLRYVRRQVGIKSVYSLHDEYRVGRKLHGAPGLDACAALEVVGRQGHPFAGKEAVQVGVEAFEVESIERLIVVVAILVARGILAVDEIVVERYGGRGDEARHELDGEPLGEGRFAR